MSSKRVKVIGYSKAVKTESGIAHRNFSESLVGNQYTSNGGTTLFTLGNFRVTTNLDPKKDKLYRTSQFSNFYNQGNLGMDEELSNILNKQQLTLNLDKTDIRNYAYFGSFKEYIRVTLEHIVTMWPASLYVNSTNKLNPSNPLPTYENYIYDKTLGTATFDIHISSIKNDFGINIKEGGSIASSFNKDNKLRDFTGSFTQYSIVIGDKRYPIIDFTGYTEEEGYLNFKVNGNPFEEVGNINYHIKPNEDKINMFFMGLNDFESHLLNRVTNFKAEFSYNYETEDGNVILGNKVVQWPISDGYNIDFKSPEYGEYVNDLLEIAESSDETKSNIISNKMVSKSIFEWDTIDQKMGKTLKVYGRNFDDLKRHSTGIKYANNVTYDKKNNTPDALIKNLARTLGWELTTSLFNIDLNEDFLTTKGDLKMSPVQSEIEFWRRLIINSPWVWKSKGTRKVVEFLLKFVGTPEGLVTFNEYVYKASNMVDVEELKTVFELNGLTYSENEIPVDGEGYPKVLANNDKLYFQKGGLWYRQTTGDDSNMDVLSGNNPHSGPYDAGYEYINQFNTLIPNFKPVTITNSKVYNTVDKTFVNYDYGKFDKFFENDVITEINLDVDFQNIYTTEMDKAVGPNFDYSDCEVYTIWNVESYLDGELETTTQMYYDTEGTIPNSSDYIGALEGVKNSLSLNSEVQGNTYRFIENLLDCEAGTQLNGKKLEIRFKLEFEYGCYEPLNCDNLVVTGKTAEGLVLFENNNENVVPYIECCRDLGYTSKLAIGGFNCINQVDPMSAASDVYVFMDTTSMDAIDGESAKAGVTQFHNQYKEEYTNYTGKLYFIPTTNERWLDYGNMVYNGSIPITTIDGWDQIAVLPPNLNTPEWVPPKELMVIALLDESNSPYHSPSLSDGFTGQPTTHFINNYKSLLTRFHQRDFTFFKGLVYPIIKDTTGEGGAFILHTMAAIKGDVLTQDEIDKTGTPVDVSILKTQNPYANYVVDVDTQVMLRPLKHLNWSAIYNRTLPASDVYNSDRFVKDLYNLMINNEDDNIYTVDSTSINASETDITV
jgi:hypothetical protein